MKTNKPFSFFEGGGIKKITPSKTITIDSLNELIRSNKYKEKVLKYRETKNNYIKLNLDYICPSGVFKERSNSGLIDYSSIISIDIDKIDRYKDIENLKLDLILSDHTPLFLYISPSGKGLKVFYEIDLEDESFDDYFIALCNYFESVWAIQIDKHCSDISRASFLSYDPSAILLKDTTTLGTEFVKTYKPIIKNNEDSLNRKNDNKTMSLEQEIKAIEIMTKSVQKKSSFEEGNRNNFILELSSCLNRVGVSYETALNHLLEYEEDGFDKAEIKTTVWQSYKKKEFHGIAPLNLTTSAEEDFCEPIESLTEGLPKALEEFVLDMASVYQVPIEFPLLSCLTASSSVLKKKIEIFCGKYINYPQIWALLIADPGIGKSEQLDLAFRPIKELDKECFETYKAAHEFWKEECFNAKKAKRFEPTKPILKQYIVDDFTPESLYLAMQRNEGVTLFRDEINGWVSDFQRYGNSGEVSRYLSIFNNGQFSIIRKGDEPLLIQKPYMSIIGGVQPALLVKILNSNDMLESGLAARFLYVFPQNLKRSKYNDNQIDDDVYNEYKKLIFRMSEHKQVRFTLNEDAKVEYIKFSDTLTDLINNTTDLFLKTVYSKMNIYCLRFALLVQALKEESINIVTLDTLKYSIKLCNYFISTAKVVAKLLQNNSKAEKNISKLDVAKFMYQNYDYSQSKIAEIIGVSQPYLSQNLRKTHISQK